MGQIWVQGFHRLLIALCGLPNFVSLIKVVRQTLKMLKTNEKSKAVAGNFLVRGPF